MNEPIAREELVTRVYVAAATSAQFRRFAQAIKLLAKLEGTPQPKVLHVEHTDALQGRRGFKLHILPHAKVRDWNRMNSFCRGRSISYYYWTEARMQQFFEIVDRLENEEVMPLDAGLQPPDSVH